MNVAAKAGARAFRVERRSHVPRKGGAHAWDRTQPVRPTAKKAARDR
jgi:hypothetical protein